MREHKWFFVALFLVVAAGSLAWYLFVSERSRLENLQQETVRPLDLERAMIEERSSGTTSVTLYFPQPGHLPDAADFLVGEEREIPTLDSRILMARQLVQEVLKGRRPSAEAGIVAESAESGGDTTKLRQLYLMDDGTAVVDLHPVPAGALLGIVEEYGLIASITRSLRENLPEVQQVKFLVDGRERATLAGHVSLARSFR
ncbi:MAG: hypothetical protein Kow001_24580 [Acidobacteriota bacterium]